MQHDDWLLRVEDMALAAEQILDFTRGASFEQFRSSPMMMNAVLYSFSVLGEAARHVPAQVLERHPEIEWHLIRGMRNTIVHEYTGVRLETVGHTIRMDIPELLPKLHAIPASET